MGILSGPIGFPISPSDVFSSDPIFFPSVNHKVSSNACGSNQEIARANIKQGGLQEIENICGKLIYFFLTLTNFWAKFGFQKKDMNEKKIRHLEGAQTKADVLPLSHIVWEVRERVLAFYRRYLSFHSQ